MSIPWHLDNFSQFQILLILFSNVVSCKNKFSKLITQFGLIVGEFAVNIEHFAQLNAALVTKIHASGTKRR